MSEMYRSSALLLSSFRADVRRRARADGVLALWWCDSGCADARGARADDAANVGVPGSLTCHACSTEERPVFMRPEPDGSWRCTRCTTGFTREFFDWLQGRLVLYGREPEGAPPHWRAA